MYNQIIVLIVFYGTLKKVFYKNEVYYKVYTVKCNLFIFLAFHQQTFPRATLAHVWQVADSCCSIEYLAWQRYCSLHERVLEPCTRKKDANNIRPFFLQYIVLLPSPCYPFHFLNLIGQKNWKIAIKCSYWRLLKLPWPKCTTLLTYFLRIEDDLGGCPLCMMVIVKMFPFCAYHIHFRCPQFLHIACK